MCASLTKPPRTQSWRLCGPRIDKSRNALSVSGSARFNTDAEGVAALLKQGLRASLHSASLITGQQNVALDFVTECASRRGLSMDGPDYVVPATEGGGFAGLTASATELLNKVNTMPFDQIGKNLDASSNR